MRIPMKLPEGINRVACGIFSHIKYKDSGYVLTTDLAMNTAPMHYRNILYSTDPIDKVLHNYVNHSWFPAKNFGDYK